MRILVGVAAGAIVLLACGPKWTSSDTISATDNVHAQMLVEQMCAEPAGVCEPSQVRALERAALCGNEAMLYRHGQVIPDAGVQCEAP